MSITARIACFAVLWGPVLLLLALMVPPSPETAALHLTTTTGLALIGGRVLRLLLQVPLAAAGDGRHRIIPRYPGAAVLLGAMGTSLLMVGGFLAIEGSYLHAAAGFFTGITSLVSAVNYRRMGLWEGYLAIRNGALVVETPRANYRISLDKVRIYRRRQDGSVLVMSADRALEALILPRAARGRYWVDGADSLVRALGEWGEVQEVDSLLAIAEGH